MSTTIIRSQKLSPIVAQAMEFTAAYQEFSEAHPAVREAMCLRTQFPALLGSIREDDTYAGRRPPQRLVYFAPIWWAAFPPGEKNRKHEGKQGGYAFDFAAAQKLALTDADKEAVAMLSAFWEKECCWSKAQARWDSELRANLDPAGPLPVGGGYPVGGNAVGFTVAMDLDKLLRLGIPGLIAEIEQRQASGGEPNFLSAARMALDIFVDVCGHYERQAQSLADSASSETVKTRLEAIAQSLRAIAARPPRSLREAVQLAWLYMMVGCTGYPEAWGLDEALGDFYAHDIDAGLLSEEQAMDLLLPLWRLFRENGETALCRIMLGGKFRRNPANADRFAIAAMEASRRHRDVTPQLTLRTWSGQDPRLLRKGLEVIGEGCLYPMLYNDDVAVPAAAQSLKVPLDVAEKYHPLGCGEYMLAGCSPSLLDVVWNVPKSLEAALHDGKNCLGAVVGPSTGKTELFDTFEKLYSAFAEQMRFAAKLSARVYQVNCEVLPQDCAYLFASILTDDCITRGRSILDGGAQYIGACVMGHGFTNAADSLTAIRKVVYEDKHLSLTELVAALDADFIGYENVRRLLLEAPKFGNDIKEADDMLSRLFRDIRSIANAAGNEAGLHFYTVSNVNPGGYWTGHMCGASADGRRKGEPFAIGNAPTAGNDRSGLTALLNSLARLDSIGGGATTNIKLSSELFKGSTNQAETIFKVFFANGGSQANVTVLNRGDLEAALKNPQDYPHLLVRLGGWSARFVDLERSIQEEIVRRTLH